MALSDKEKEEIARTLLTASPEQLAELKARLDGLNADLQDLNTAYPATKAFLDSRGLSHVRELGAQGRKDLMTHLQTTLDRLRGPVH